MKSKITRISGSVAIEINKIKQEAAANGIFLSDQKALDLLLRRGF